MIEKLIKKVLWNYDVRKLSHAGVLNILRQEVQSRSAVGRALKRRWNEVEEFVLVHGVRDLL